MPPGFSTADFYYLLPEIVLTTAALVLLVADVVITSRRHAVLTALAIASIVATFVAMLPFAGTNVTISRGLLAIDGFAFFFKIVFLLSALFTILMSTKFLEVEGARAGEYYFLILCATLGMMVMASAVELITIFIGLETMAVSFYILAGYLKPNRRSNEAAVKYFLLGAFSLGILLYGMSLLYGLTGSTNLRRIAIVLAGQDSNLLIVLAVMLVIAGVGFKIAAVPFHGWAPDVYEGAPTPVTAFLSVGSKAASFAMLLRIFIEGLPIVKAQGLGLLFGVPVGWTTVFYVLSVLTMTLGNLAAITQSNLKRMLAYSSIAHAGYVLMGVVAGTPRGITAMLIYLFIYAFMQLGAFTVVSMLRRRDVVGDELKDLTGLYRQNPMAAIAMLLFMLSLGGIPPTAGFMGKFWLFSATIESGYFGLAVIGVLNSAISLYYYVRVVVFMWIKEDAMGSRVVPSGAVRLALAVAIAGTLVLGVFPQPLFEFAEASARTLGVVGPAATMR